MTTTKTMLNSFARMRMVLSRMRFGRPGLAAALTLGLAASMVGAPAAAQAPAAAPAITFAPEAAAKPAGGPVKGARYVVDPTHTFVMYEMGHYGTTTNRGRFSTQDGIVRMDPSGQTGTVDITMDMSSINTGVDLLNRHVQSKDFLNIAEFPTGRFVAGKIDITGDKVSAVDGQLTLLGQTKPVKLTANRFGCYLSPLINRQICGGDFETWIERSQWGVTWGIPFGFEDRIKLIVQVEAINVN